MTPQSCTRPGCETEGLFTSVGMIDGRYWGQCYRHALAYAQDQADRANAELASLKGHAGQIPGQLELIR